MKTNEWTQGIALNDEWANYITHGFALFLSLFGWYFLLQNPLQDGDLWKSSIFGIYGASLVLMYAISTLYHYLKNPSLKKKFRVVDHCAIYLFIAGSYTPFTLVLLFDEGGPALFGIIWAMACIGITFKIFFTHRFKALSLLFYLSMGWLVMFMMDALIANLPAQAIYLLVAGGLCYTAGIIFYVLDSRRFFHAIWHIFVLSGSACHYICIFLYL